VRLIIGPAALAPHRQPRLTSNVRPHETRRLADQCCYELSRASLIVCRDICGWASWWVSAKYRCALSTLGGRFFTLFSCLRALPSLRWCVSRDRETTGGRSAAATRHWVVTGFVVAQDVQLSGRQTSGPSRFRLTALTADRVYPVPLHQQAEPPTPRLSSLSLQRTQRGVARVRPNPSVEASLRLTRQSAALGARSMINQRPRGQCACRGASPRREAMASLVCDASL